MHGVSSHPTLHRWIVVALCAALGSGATSAQLPQRAAAIAEGVESSPRVYEELIWAPITGSRGPKRRIPDPKKVEVSALQLDDFKARLDGAASELGSISIGRANRGYLFNATQLAESEHWHVMDPGHAFGTEESVAAIQNAIEEVNRLFPDSPRLVVGHLSRRRGGWLRPHRSHQSGRDVDLGFYYTTGEDWYKTATEDNFDVARNWALLSALLKTTDVEYIFVSRMLHASLRAQAERIGEDPAFVERVFEGPGPKLEPILRHARGHQTHFHVRFLSPVAVANATRARQLLGRRAWRSAYLLNMLKARGQRAQKTKSTAIAKARKYRARRHRSSKYRSSKGRSSKYRSQKKRSR